MASTQASAAAFQNGSFELPGISAGNRTALGTTLTINGWLSDGNTDGEAVFYQATGFADFQARDGLAGIGFGGSGGSGGRLSQSFDTVAGQTYTVAYSTTAQQAGSGAQSYLADVLGFVTGAGSSVLASQANAIPAVNRAWVDHSFSFIASSATSRLRFADTSDGGVAAGINWALDGVSVTASSVMAPIPEPSTYALMMAGLAVTLVAVRRKAQGAATKGEQATA